MSDFRFDDRLIPWKVFGELPHFHYHILHIDEAARIADVLFRFAAGEQIILHRHKALNLTFVIQGEHRLYEPDGRLKEARPSGRFTVSPASDDPHREGGGSTDAVVLFSIRPGTADELYEVLDDALNPIGQITFQTLVDLHRAAQAAA